MLIKPSQSIARACLVTNNAGISLIEIVLVSALFVLLSAVLIGNIIYGQETTMLAGNRSRAVFIAKEGIEAVRNIRDESFGNLVDGTYGLQNIGNQWQFSGVSDQSDIFVRQIEISTIGSNVKQIISRVNWQQNPQRSGEAALTTYLTNWRETANCEIDAAGTYIEAENFTGTISQGTATFVFESSVGGYNGMGYLRSNGGSYVDPPDQQGKQYLVNFTTAGTYNVWIRGYGLDNLSDSIWIGLNNIKTGSLNESIYNQWIWTNNIQSGLNTINVPSAGNYYLNIWVRENSHLIDGIYITTGVEVPSGGIPINKTIIDPTACTLTPPIDSCNAYCQDQSYLSGTCRADTNQCTNNGEVYQSGGDLYCTGGASVDTCCCLPGADITPPAAVADLALSNPSGTSIDLDWTAPGDDGAGGTATTYDIRYSNSVITNINWASATQVTGEPSPSIAGSPEGMTVTGLSPSTLYYFAIKTSDEVPNQSALSNVPSLSTASGVGNWSNPTNSANLGFSGNDDGWKIQIQGNYAYLVRASGIPDFVVLDLSLPDSPTVIASLSVAGNLTNIYVLGNYAYLSSSLSELLVYNISTPASPIFTGSFDATGTADALGVYVVGTTAYIVRATSVDNELVIINVANPAAMTQLGSLNLSDSGNEIYISGNYAYIASDNNNQELQVVNISNPGSLSINASINLAGTTNCNTITGFDSTLVLGCANGDLRTINISTPTSPSVLGANTTSVNDVLRDLSLGNLNTYVFAASDDNIREFAIYDISNLSTPTLLGSSNVASDFNGVAYYATGDRAYCVGDDNTNEVIVFVPIYF